ncbi:ABC transporter permease [Salinibacterium xinjiangense]|uniref:Energy-coupling factor transport system substrate-specific component n=1 Tax=Salinibacterium xinjiangense TaxID=386302 RepID=A0A2C8ZX16_9MICO|nr:ECF transporter S component [Salinibacterium xinjiangense]GGL01368.1 ABC transporter permease [Salinibacterium xinjiangense]SOE70583.1 energy-coupling factor transport system substrate-specific component [Salinibacterium xinjiangense]
MTTTLPTALPSTLGSRFRWRVVDIVVASVIGVASGLVFVAWNVASNPITDPLAALLPGLQAVGGGFWLFAGVLTAIVVRKPGAALYGELVAATVSALIGNQWGPLTLVSGAVQGLGAELVFAIFLYANWRFGVAILAGVGAGIGMAVTDLTLWYPGSDTPFIVIYTISAMVGGALIAGLLSWLAMRGLARTGALNRFAAGREIAKRV